MEPLTFQITLEGSRQIRELAFVYDLTLEEAFDLILALGLSTIKGAQKHSFTWADAETIQEAANKMRRKGT